MSRTKNNSIFPENPHNQADTTPSDDTAIAATTPSQGATTAAVELDPAPLKPHVYIIMGSDSDWPILSQATLPLDMCQIPYAVQVISAHRTPIAMVDFAQNARSNGVKVIIAGAGGAAHLPGMVAALTTLPVIGVPVSLARLDGLDSLLSIVQMPTGVPVATVAINGGYNAGLLASQILAVTDAGIALRLQHYRDEIADQVQEKNLQVQESVLHKNTANPLKTQ